MIILLNNYYLQNVNINTSSKSVTFIEQNYAIHIAMFIKF